MQNSIRKQAFIRGKSGILDIAARVLMSEGIPYSRMKNSRWVTALETHSAIIVAKSYVYRESILSIDSLLVDYALKRSERIIFLVAPPWGANQWYSADPSAFRVYGYENFRGENELFTNLTISHMRRCSSLVEAYTCDVKKLPVPEWPPIRHFSEPREREDSLQLSF